MTDLRYVLRQPKNRLMALLLILAGIGILRHPTPLLLVRQLAVGVAAAVFAEWSFFGGVRATRVQSATITGMLVGMILVPGVDLKMVWLAAVAAVASKKLVVLPTGRHVFNPAASGLVLAAVLLGNKLNWWGLSSAVIVILGAGFILLDLRRLSLPFAYIILRAASAALVGDVALGPGALLLPNILFAFVMVVEPKTSPGRRSVQWVFGGLCGVLATLFFRWFPFLDGDLLALLSANLLRPALEGIPVRPGRPGD